LASGGGAVSRASAHTEQLGGLLDGDCRRQLGQLVSDLLGY
jgi:hypothetical protein